jgi:peptidyl-prolyl cis-trans isomerase C
MRHLSLSRVVSLLVLLSFFAISACNKNEASADKSISSKSGVHFAGTNAYMSVNGETIDRELVLAYAKSRGFDLANTQQVRQAAEKLAEYVLLAQAGHRDGAGSADFAVAKLQSGASDFLSKAETALNITDADLQNAYESQLAATGGVELHVQKILTSDVNTAQLIQTQLASGKPFDAVMTELKGNLAVQENQDLGWTNVLAFPEALRQPLLEIKSGGITPNGVSLPNGYFFLQVKQSRALTPPPFADVQAGLKQAMTKSKLREVIEREKSAAKIEFK